MYHKSVLYSDSVHYQRRCLPIVEQCIKSKPSNSISHTTIELMSNFVGKADPFNTIVCRAQLIHGGKTAQVWDAEVLGARTKKSIAFFDQQS